MDDEKKWDFEVTRVEIDLFKHLATLSAGAIALVAGFLRSLIEFDDHATTLVVIVVSFSLCILGSVIASIILLMFPGYSPRYSPPKMPRPYIIFGFLSTLLSLLGFMTGISGLLVFILSNISF